MNTRCRTLTTATGEVSLPATAVTAAKWNALYERWCDGCGTLEWTARAVNFIKVSTAIVYRPTDAQLDRQIGNQCKLPRYNWFGIGNGSSALRL